MTDAALSASDAPTRNLKDKALPLVLFLGVLCLLFRPLLVNDLREILTPSPVTGPDGPLPPDMGKAWLNFGSDLLTFLTLAVTLVVIIVGRIGSIAFNTFREAVRNRILYFILFFALILMGASGVFKELAMAAHDRLVVDLGLTCISFFGLLVAVFVGISLVYNELERKTIYTIVSKPVHRYQFLLGKFFGLLMTIYVIVAIMTLFFFIVLNYQSMTTDDALLEGLQKTYETAKTSAEAAGREFNAEEDLSLGWIKTRFLLGAAGKATVLGVGNVLGFKGGAVAHNLMIVTGMICLELMIVTGFAILFSSFTTPTLSAVFTILIFLAGRLNEDIIRLAVRIGHKAMQDHSAPTIADLPFAIQLKIQVAKALSVLVPNLDSLNMTADAIHKDVLSVWRYPILYSLCYTASILMLAILIFRKRNFK